MNWLALMLPRQACSPVCFGRRSRTARNDAYHLLPQLVHILQVYLSITIAIKKRHTWSRSLSCGPDLRAEMMRSPL